MQYLDTLKEYARVCEAIGRKTVVVEMMEQQNPEPTERYERLINDEKAHVLRLDMEKASLEHDLRLALKTLEFKQAG